MKRTVLLRWTALAILAGCMAAPARAGFTGYYDVSNFTLSNDNGGDGFIDVTNAPASVDLFGADNAVGFNSTDWSITTSAGTERVFFNYTYTSNDVSGGVFDQFNFLVNGNSVLNVGPSVPPFGSVSGSFSTSVNPGDVIAFEIFSVDSILGRGDVIISEFGIASPEPTTIATAMTGGFLSLLALRRRRRSS